jgi:TnpA family transposase
MPLNGEDRKLQALKSIQEIFDKNTTELLRACQKSEFSKILKSFDEIDTIVNKNIKVKLQNCNVRRSSERFFMMMKEFCHHYDGFISQQIKQSTADLLSIQKKLKTHLCIINVEDTVEELLEFLLDFD